MNTTPDNAYGPVPVTEPLALKSNEGLGPLPLRRIRHVYNESKGYECDCWMENEVRAYAAAAVAAERERCAALLDAEHERRKHLDNHAGVYARMLREQK